MQRDPPTSSAPAPPEQGLARTTSGGAAAPSAVPRPAPRAAPCHALWLRLDTLGGGDAHARRRPGRRHRDDLADQREEELLGRARAPRHQHVGVIAKTECDGTQDAPQAMHQQHVPQTADAGLELPIHRQSKQGRQRPEGPEEVAAAEAARELPAAVRHPHVAAERHRQLDEQAENSRRASLAVLAGAGAVAVVAHRLSVPQVAAVGLVGAGRQLEHKPQDVERRAKPHHDQQPLQRHVQLALGDGQPAHRLAEHDRGICCRRHVQRGLARARAADGG
mmetsp:Transcript_110036/g.307663  ORF Transcript_110036/g.307663 Transcript_110036/m.307663 type:complete len:278 (+) Transcript_110036:32-865(+)